MSQKNYNKDHVSSGEISRVDLSDKAIAELEKCEQRENQDIPPMPETLLQAELSELGLLYREAKNVANPSPEFKAIIRRHRITEKGRAALRSRGLNA